MKQLFAGLIALSVAASAVPQQPVEYRFDEVKRKVTLTTPKQSIQVNKGQRAQSGDLVQTGWFSYALIASERYRAKFEIFSATDVKLASGAPGVILSLERGKLHAIFDKITGNEPRVVQTPGALLAVRGTQYEAEVGNDGKTTLRVSEGTVEVRSDVRKEPIFVHAGEMATYDRHEAPVLHPMPKNGGPEAGHRSGPDDHGHDRGQGPRQPMPQPPQPRPGGH